MCERESDRAREREKEKRFKVTEREKGRESDRCIIFNNSVRVSKNIKKRIYIQKE